jgi:tetratricopeptide (TPR) repeat protein
MIDQNDPRLTAYVLGELSSAEMAEIEAAIHESPELAAAVEEIAGMTGMLGEAYESEEKLRLSDEQKKTLSRNPVKSRSDEARRWLAVAVAASLAAVLFGGRYVFQEDFNGAAQRARVAQNEKIETNVGEITFKIESRTQSFPITKMRTETRQRIVPVQRFRYETEEVELEDGTTGSKVVETPYTENVTQSYAVQVPYVEEVERTFDFKVPHDADGNQIAEADYDKFGIDPDELIVRPEVVYRTETKTRLVPVQKTRRETRTRTVPVTRYRTEEREVTLADGSTVTKEIEVPYIENVPQTYQVAVPYTENVTQSYSVEVPYTANGQQIAASDYDWYDIDPSKMRAPTSSMSVVVMDQGMGGMPALAASDSADLNGNDLAAVVPQEQGRPGLIGGDGLDTGGQEMTTRNFDIASRTMQSNDDLFDDMFEQVYLEVAGVQQQQWSEELPADLDGFAELKSKNGSIIGFEVSGKLDEGTVLNEDELGEAVDFALTTDEEMDEEGQSGKRLPSEEETESLLRRQQVELSEAKQEAVVDRWFSRLNEGKDKAERLTVMQDELQKFERVKTSEEAAARIWEMQQKAQLRKKPDADREGVETAIRSRLLEAKAEGESIKGRVGIGHPNFEAAQAQIRVLERQLKEIEEENEISSLTVKSIPDEVLIEKYKKKLKEQIAKAKAKSWKRVKATPNTTRLMVGDKEELSLNGMQVNAQVDGFRARVLVDYFYYNDRERQLEGNFKLRLPDDASLYYFAFGESAYEFSGEGKLAAEEFHSDGRQFVSLAATNVKRARKNQWDNVKEARVVPKEKAAHAFRETVRRRIDPALVEWSGAGVFSAKVFPLSPKKLHRIVVGYDVNLTRTADGQKFELALPEQTGQCRVEVNVQEIEGVTYSATPEVDPIPTEAEGKLQKRFVFDNDEAPLSSVEIVVTGGDNVLLTTNTLPPVGLDDAVGKQERLGREHLDKESGGIKQNKDAAESGGKVSDEEVHPPRSHPSKGTDRDRPSLREGGVGTNFWTMQIKPDLPVENAAANSRAIFMVDTSLSSSPDKFNVWLKMLEATLENNRDSLKEFDVLFFNVDGHFWKGKYVTNTAENVAELKKTLENLALEGATDLYSAVQAVSEANWIGEGGGRPDLFLLSDGAATWGETDLRLIDQVLQRPQLGSLFAYQTGLTGTSISGLRFLAGQSGGAVFSVATEDEIQTASMAHRKRPWRLKSIQAEGANDVLTAGRVQWVYPGQTITLVGRGNVEQSIELELRRGSETKKVAFTPTPIQSDLASRMYGHVAVQQLESLGEKVFDVSAAYARHFRITGQTCSLLMLESEEDYKRFDIKPQEDLFVVKAKAASKLVREALEKNFESLADPKARLLTWLNRLESMPGMKFKMPTALKLALDDIQVEAISQPMNCSLTTTESLSGAYQSLLRQEQLGYDRVSAEARRRMNSSVDDAIKVYSSLIERNPGDIIAARDVAFTAMDLERPAAAFHLLRRVAKARPFQGNIYPAIGQCLAQLGKADMAIVYYEIAMNGTFQRQGNEFKQIVATEYIHLLRKIVSGKLESSVKDYAAARLETLGKHLPFGTADVVVTMMWNQDQTDVDLHVFEPSGEECSYQHKRTKSGGQITSDITTGFGPEMYFNANAPRGRYEVKAKFFSNGQNRTSTRNKVYMTVIRNFGTDEESLTRQTIELNKVGEKMPVMTLGVE